MFVSSLMIMLQLNPNKSVFGGGALGRLGHKDPIQADEFSTFKKKV